MADQKPAENKSVKSPNAEREEKIFSSWKEKGIFEKSLAKDSPKGEFIFYEGPPTANGRPGIHHLEARAFKDAIPRYKTMQGFHVRRKGGWDTHGLPVELAVEKQLGFQSKKDIEAYGIAAFNEKCKESVWTYVHEWEGFTDRMGYWVDLKDPYITYKPNYIESVWNVIKEADKQGLLYKDYKVVPWCPRDGTALSSHELAQGYETDKDLTVIAKFRLKSGQKLGGSIIEEGYTIYGISWTTTPWTLPGNVALAVGAAIDYVQIKVGDVSLVVAKTRLSVIREPYQIEREFKGSDLVGLEYEPLYPFEKDNLTGKEKDKLKNAFKIYAADFVTTTDGTGIVHIAPMYGQDDFELGTKHDLPKYHLVNEDGTFKKEVGFLAGKFVKNEEVAVEIIKDLANRPSGSLLFHKEKHEHSYPHCWRCHTPLIYFARDSWYIRMSSLRNKLVKENEGIHWEPDYIKEGRFGEWLRDVKDWAISRERYWGTPLPVWNCETCKKRHVIGAMSELARKPKNTYWIMRHGEAENNVKGILSGDPTAPHHLTEKGKAQVGKAAELLKSKGATFDLVFVSPFIRTQETAAIVREKFGMKADRFITDERIRELGSGSWNGRKVSEYITHFNHFDRFDSRPDGVENFADIKKRMGDFLYDIEKEHEGKNILIITHESPAHLLIAAAMGLDRKHTIALRTDAEKQGEFLPNAYFRKLEFSVLPHNPEYETDLHRPFIDEVTLSCSCGGTMKRAKEVLDVWFDSGSMPYAQDHYPFENKELIDGGVFKKAKGFPADYISEAIDQTRGWFYTLHAVSALMGKGKAYKNVICLGHILDAKGKKMSKSIGNVIDPWTTMDKYGADAVRFWMYSINQPGESKNFDEKTVDEVVKKVFNLASNVASFYKMYEDRGIESSDSSANVLDRWIISRLNQVTETVTTHMDKYVFLESTRSIRDFIADLSQWYLRRSRDRFKGDDASDKKAAIATLKHVLVTLAKVMAPFTPFFAEYLYQEAGGKLESVHLEDWPKAGKVDSKLVDSMNTVRSISSRGLEARMAAKINVRQPLSKLKVQSAKCKVLNAELVQIIKDEINVKEVEAAASLEKEVELDTAMTPELREEGDLRELIREIQDLRKEAGLSVGDAAILIVSADKKDFVSKHEAVIRKTASISSIESGETLSLKR